MMSSMNGYYLAKLVVIGLVDDYDDKMTMHGVHDLPISRETLGDIVKRLPRLPLQLIFV